MSLEFRALTGIRHRRVALISRDTVVVGENLDRSADHLAIQLARAGIASGQRVALLLGNTLQFVLCLLGLMRLRACAVLLSTQFTKTEITDAVNCTQATAVLGGSADCAKMLQSPSGTFHSESSLSIGSVEPLVLWRTPYTQAAASNDEVSVQFTSGGSGRAKIVARTAANLADELDNFASRLPLGDEDGTICPCPLSHAYGLIDGLLLPLFTGRPSILVEQFLPSKVVDIVRRYRPRMFVGVPAMYKALARAFGATAADLSSLRVCASAGVALPQEVFDMFHARYGLSVHQQYGTTETGALTLNLLDSQNASPLDVGTPLPGREIDILDDDGNQLSPDKDGEIVVRCAATASGYLGNPVLSVEKFRRGRYFTGDLGHLSESGSLTLTGRRVPFINVGGRKVDPTEVENILKTFDGIAECVVLAHSNATGEETVRAVVVARRKTSSSEIRQFCRQWLAPYKIPGLVTFVEALPRSAVGKILTKYLVNN